MSIPATQTSVTLQISVLHDNLVEGNETVILTIQPSGTYNIGTAAATVNIADDPPIVSIVATTPNANEAGPVNGLFTFTRTGGNIAAALLVNFTVGGTATNGTDYTAINTFISIPATQTSVTLHDQRPAGQRRRTWRRNGRPHHSAERDLQHRHRGSDGQHCR